MAAKPSIILQERPAVPNDWRRFVAVLCLIEFYVQFVANGQLIADQYQHHHSRSPFNQQELYSIVQGAAGMLRALMFFLLGRALWRRSNRILYWLVPVIVFSLASLVIDATIRVLELDMQRARMSLLWGGASTAAPGAVLIRSSGHLPWLGLLIVGIWLTRRQKARASHHQPWIFFAAVWLICAVALPLGENTFQQAEWMFETPWLKLSYFLLFPAIAIALLLHWRYVRTLALILFAAEMTSLGFSAFVIPELVYVAVRAHRIAHALSPDISPWMYFVGNQHSFRALFVNLVADAGPLLLITLYAWRVPMAALPDDGSPYPRRYCARCLYNLQGLESDCCPECGQELKAAATVTLKLK